MSAPTALRRTLAGLLLAMSVVGVTRASEATSLPDAITLDGPAVLTSAPGHVVTYPIRFANTTPVIQEVIAEVKLPEGWALMIPPRRFSVSPNRVAARVLAVRIPATARAGSHSLTVQARDAASGRRLDEFSMTVEVRAVPDLGLTFGAAPPRARAGKPFRTSLEVTNLGNSRASVVLELRTTPFAEVTLEREALELEVGQAAQIWVQVRPPVSAASSQPYRLSAVARLAEEPDVLATASMRVLVTSAPGQVGRSDRIDPLALSISTVGSGSKSGMQGQVLYEGRPLLGRDDQVELLMRIPDRRGHTVFADRDEYRASFTSEALQVQLGDHAYQLSTLTETGRFGFGAGLSYETGRFEVGGFAERSRKQNIGESQQAAYAGVILNDATRLRVNLLNRNGLATGTVGTIQGLFEPITGTLVELEAGTGLARGGGGSAASASASGRYRRGSFDLRYLGADPTYAGRFGESRIRQAGGVLTQGRLTFSGSWLDQKRTFSKRYSFISGTRRNQAARLEGRYNTTVFGRGAFLRVNHQYRSYELRVPGSADGVSRQNRFLQLGAGARIGRLRAEGDVQLGRSAFELGGGSSDYRIWSLRLTRSGRRLSGGAAVSRLTGAIFSGLASQERVQVSANLNWRPTNRTQLHARVFSINDQIEATRSTVSSQLGVEHTIGAVKLALRGRHFAYGQELAMGRSEYAVSITRELGVPRFGGNRTHRLSGRLTDGATGAGMPGVWLNMGDHVTQTDSDGHYEFPGLADGEYDLEVDRLSAGIEYIPLSGLPRRVRVQGSDLSGVDLAMVVRGEVTGRVLLRARGPGATLFEEPPLVEAGGFRGLIVELSDDLGSIRRVSGLDGGLDFGGVRPGQYRVRVWPGSVPEGHTVEAPARVEIESGEKAELQIQVIPKARSMKFVPPPAVLVEVSR